MLLTLQELCTFLKADDAVVLSLIEAGSLPPPLDIGDRTHQVGRKRFGAKGLPKVPIAHVGGAYADSPKHLEEKRHTSANINARLAANQASHDK